VQFEWIVLHSLRWSFDRDGSKLGIELNRHESTRVERSGRLRPYIKGTARKGYKPTARQAGRGSLLQFK